MSICCIWIVWFATQWIIVMAIEAMITSRNASLLRAWISKLGQCKESNYHKIRNESRLIFWTELTHMQIVLPRVMPIMRYFRFFSLRYCTQGDIPGRLSAKSIDAHLMTTNSLTDASHVTFYTWVYTLSRAMFCPWQWCVRSSIKNVYLTINGVVIKIYWFLSFVGMELHEIFHSL